MQLRGYIFLSDEMGFRMMAFVVWAVCCVIFLSIPPVYILRAWWFGEPVLQNVLHFVIRIAKHVHSASQVVDYEVSDAFVVAEEFDDGFC
jgi:hypothetical protein